MSRIRGGIVVSDTDPVFDGPDTAVADLLDDTPKPPVVVAPVPPQLENIVGNLLDAYRLTVPGTMLHSDQLMNARRLSPITPQREDLQQLAFYTADGAIYFLDGKTPKLALTREADNLVLRHIDDAINSYYQQLTQTKNYRPDPAEADISIKSATTEIFDLTQLKLKKHDDEFSYMAISTTKYDKLNPEQRRLAERIYGQGTDFIDNMAMLATAQIAETKIYVLNPGYVKTEARSGYVGRASWLSSFDNLSSFDASDRNININDRLRGVRRGASVSEQVSATGGALQSAVSIIPPSMSLVDCYNLILSNPAEAVKALDNQKASALAGLLQTYLSSRVR